MRLSNVILLLLLLPLAARTEEAILKTPFCSVDLGGQWVAESQLDTGVYRLVAEKFKTIATIGGQNWSQAPVDLELAAREYLKVRRLTEQQLVKEAGRTLTIEESLKRQPFGYQIECWGRDSAGRQFRYWAIVGPSKVVTIYMETYNQSELGLEQVFRDFLKGFKV